MSQLEIIPLGKTFVAEVRGVNWDEPLPEEQFAQIQDGINKYGVLVFRKTSLDDKRHITFASHFGTLDDMSPHVKIGWRLRLPDLQIMDVSNLDPDGNVVNETDPGRLAVGKGNEHWHADLSFNSPRSGYSILRGHKLPPPGMGGETEYLDARSAYEGLSEEMKEQMNRKVGNHSLWHNRKLGAPEYYADVDPATRPMAKHRLVTAHPGSGRKTLFCTTSVYSIDGMSVPDSQNLVRTLLEHGSKGPYVYRLHWENDGDLVMWDNTAVLHRAVKGGSYVGKYARDMRRTVSFDTGPEAYGLNDRSKPFRDSINPEEKKENVSKGESSQKASEGDFGAIDLGVNEGGERKDSAVAE